ncbi:MAG: Metallo-beta-lactamase superfamily protein [Burkholderiaceae bacterium]|nr:Metallo-beta-lactamase superfamily protein [Burkholderiaceae bacterium]
MTKQQVKITVLVDYEAAEGLETEHGFAAWVEVGDHHILFDTGQTGAMQANAAKLGLELNRAEALVLSHGHFDHTGTLPDFLAENEAVHVYFAHGAHIDRYSCKPGTPVRSIGMPENSRLALAQLPAERLHELKAPHYLLPGVGITGPVPRIASFEDAGGPFFLDPDSRNDDRIEDDQSMWFETDEGLVILLGCCHAGLVNTIEYIRKVSGIHKLRGIVGGMHLVNANQQRLDRTFDEIKNWEPEFLVPCHCTGQNAAEQMQQAICSSIVKTGYAGMVISAGLM